MNPREGAFAAELLQAGLFQTAGDGTTPTTMQSTGGPSGEPGPEQWRNQMAAALRASQSESHNLPVHDHDMEGSQGSLRQHNEAHFSSTQAPQLHQPSFPSHTFVGQSLMPGTVSLSTAVQTSHAYASIPPRGNINGMTTSFAPLGNFTGGPVLGTSPHQYCGSIGYQSAPITPPPGHTSNGTNGGSPQAGAHTQGAATCTSFPVDHQPLHHGPPPGPLPEGAAPGLSPPMGHQWPPSQDQGSGQPAGVLDMMQALTQSSVMTANALQQMGGFIAEESTKRQANQGYRSLKPKRDVTQIRCNDAPTFMEEIMCFETDLHELGVTTTGEAAFFQLRAVATGHGRDVLDFALLREPMCSLHTQAMSAQTGDKLLTNGGQGRGYVRATCFEALYQYAIS